ncbi:MAG TPA: fasciclin domain-containing protein, partial [Anditalea sp.]|nr:fasciclin domain-containing protein [Anditalea sp.]
APNARSSQAIPTFRVTISALQKLSVIQPAVLDQATVLIATDEAYSQRGITVENVEEHLYTLRAVIFNQTISGKTIKGGNLVGKSYTNMMGLPLTFSAENGKIRVSDEFGNKANVIRTDWGALKSTSHFIDTVLVAKFE